MKEKGTPQWQVLECTYEKGQKQRNTDAEEAVYIEVQLLKEKMKNKSPLQNDKKNIYNELPPLGCMP